MPLTARELHLGGAVLDPARGVVRCSDGTETRLRAKTLELLVFLLGRRGRVVSRAEILDAVWRDLNVTDDSITQCIVELRRALGPDAALLHTVPRRGYVLNHLDASPAHPPFAAPLGSGVPVVAMMPFRQMLPDQDLATFGEGLLEGVVGALTSLREPVVISANTTLRFTATETDARSIGARLGADYVTFGTLRRAGQLRRVTVELTDARSAAVLWHRSFDIEQGNDFAAQDRIATVIAHTLAPRIHEVELTLARRARPPEPSAYHLLLEARRRMFRMTRADFDAAGTLLRQAEERDPDYASVQTERAAWHGLRIGQGWAEDREAETSALERALARALESDAAQPRALAMLGHNHTILRRHHDAALQLFDRARTAAPNDAEALMWTVPTFAFLGDGREAVRRAEQAMILSPEDPFLFRYQHFRSIAHFSAGEFEAAAEWGLRAERASPRYTSNLRLTAASLAAIGRAVEARSLARRSMELEPTYRVRRSVEYSPYRDAVQRQRYGEYLLQAGFPD